MRIVTYIRKVWLCCLFLSLATVAMASKGALRQILIITSYNPDTERMNTNLAELYEEYGIKSGQNANISIETMNCKNLSEALEWKERMRKLLSHHEKNPPGLIIIMGQEAWAAFLAQDSQFAHTVPVMAAMVSTNTVELPKDNVDLKTWMPESREYTEFKDFNIVGGIYYQYDIERNLDLVNRFYPQMKTLAFLSDFTFGGLCMQALVRKEFQEHSKTHLLLLDGRQVPLPKMCDNLKKMAPNTVLLIGTWRIDCNESYVLANTTEDLRKANLKLPAFSLSSVGINDWAIGGYVPSYSIIGRELADLAYNYLKYGAEKKNLHWIRPCKYIFSEPQLKAFHLDEGKLPAGTTIINQEEDFIHKYQKAIIAITASTLFLLGCLAFALYYIHRLRHLKDILVKQSKELIKAKDAAEEANRLKTSFIANMSHEIRTPLNAIVGFSELQTMDDYSKEEKVQFSSIIKENSNLLLNLINDILDISRIESGRITIALKPCELVMICHNCLASVKQAKKLENVEFQEDFPVDKLYIKIDPLRLKQVIINLLTNASKFTKKGHIRLGFTVDEQKSTIIFSVTDTGIGIPEDKVVYIFERFVKLNPFVQGTGLGLALCKVIIEGMNGHIWVDTSYKEGARFMFSIPLYPADPNDVGQEDYI